jgi:site-specific DNA-methyltransferase (adenine-specific)
MYYLCVNFLTMAEINFFNCDNIEFMKGKPDNFYDLAIVDPPYFSGPDKLGYFGANYSKTKVRRQNYKVIGNWGVPGDDYFNELIRVSKHQIIWGYNYYNINNMGSGRIIWDKINDASTFSDCEIAYCSSKEHVKVFRFMWNGMLQGDMKNKEIRIHPTQKPVKLYRWLLKNYAKEGNKILDTHGGSMSIAIACDMEGFDLDICEIDKDYFDSGVKRFNQYKEQLTLF